MLQHGSATTDAVPGLEELRRLESPSRLARRGYTSTNGTDIHRKNQEWQAERELKLQQKRGLKFVNLSDFNLGSFAKEILRSGVIQFPE